jgi:hypothetical protein
MRMQGAADNLSHACTADFDMLPVTACCIHHPSPTFAWTIIENNHHPESAHTYVWYESYDCIQPKFLVDDGNSHRIVHHLAQQLAKAKHSTAQQGTAQHGTAHSMLNKQHVE